MCFCRLLALAKEAEQALTFKLLNRFELVSAVTTEMQEYEKQTFNVYTNMFSQVHSDF